MHVQNAHKGIRDGLQWKPISMLIGALCASALCTVEAGVTNFSGSDLTNEDIDRVLKGLTTEQQVPGLALAIIGEDGVVYQNAVGVSNVETGEALNTDSVFEAASLSKPLFAYYALKLVQSEVIDLNKPLFEYLPHPGFAPESAEAAKTINARMVLSHTTGMPNWSNGKAISLSGTPGTVFSYSGEAFQYLTAAIGTYQDMGWGDKLDAQIDEYVFTPLDMSLSGFVWNKELAAHKVFGHKDGKPTDNASIGNGKTVGGAYSLHSTVGDYANFVHALITKKGLSDQLWDQMLAEHIALPDDHDGRQIGQVAWSLGLAVKQTDNGNRYVHTGNNHDFQSYMEFDPQTKIGVVYFTNSDQGEKIYESINALMEQ